MGKAKRYSLRRTGNSRLYWRNKSDAIPHFHSLLNLTDVIFISFDLEGTSHIGNTRVDEIGVSFLDTRQFLEGSEITLSSRHITTKHIRWCKRFLFGESERQRIKNIGTFIRSLFYIEDIDQSTKSSDSLRHEYNAIPNKKYRDIVLIGHGINNDVSMLSELKVDVRDILPIVDIVDTEIICRAACEKSLSLLKLLDFLGCGWPSAKLHNAGNDAVFTMRAFLALAIKTQWLGPEELLSRFQRLAFAPVMSLKKKEKSANEIAYQRAKRAQVRQEDEGKDWADTLENQLPWDDV